MLNTCTMIENSATQTNRRTITRRAGHPQQQKFTTYLPQEFVNDASSICGSWSVDVYGILP